MIVEPAIESLTFEAKQQLSVVQDALGIDVLRLVELKDLTYTLKDDKTRTQVN